MAQAVNIHPDSPSNVRLCRLPNLFAKVRVIALPTDSRYACAAIWAIEMLLERIRQIRQIDDRHPT